MIHPNMAEMVWDHFVSQAMGQLPTDITFARLKKIKERLLGSREYSDELLRHGLAEMGLYSLRANKEDVYNHLRGNFWSMVLDQWYQLVKEKEANL